MSVLIDTSHYVANRLSYDLSGNFPIMNIVAKNGKFQMRTSRVVTSILKDDTIMSDLPEIEEEVLINIRKIPFHVFEVMGSFFKKIYEKDKTESSLMLFYNEKEDYFNIWPPSQKNSSANSHYLREDDPAFVKMNNENVLVMVAHSHPWASKSAPSPSGTDNNDEKESILYMIMSNVSEIPTYTLSTCPNGKRKLLRFQDVFEVPTEIFSREEKIDMLRPEFSKSLVGEVFLKNATDEELNSVFSEYIDSSIIVEKAYKHCLDEIPENWLKRCTVNYQNYNKDYYKDYYKNYPYNNYNKNYAYDNYNWKNAAKDSIHKKENKEDLATNVSQEELYEDYKNSLATEQNDYDNYY